MSTAFDAAAVDAHEIGGIAHLQQERDVEKAAAVDEPSLGRWPSQPDEAGFATVEVIIFKTRRHRAPRRASQHIRRGRDLAVQFAGLTEPEAPN